jgi:hypothetical protein
MGNTGRTGPPEQPAGLAPQLYASADNSSHVAAMQKQWQDARRAGAPPPYIAAQAAERRMMQQRSHQRQPPGDADAGFSPSEMEQQLEMMATSLRGDQEEAEGVRKGLLMLQPLQHNGGGALARSRGRETRSAEDVDADRVLGECPGDYLSHVAAIEDAMLEAGSWVSGAQGMNAVCVRPWPGSGTQIALEAGDVIDISLMDPALQVPPPPAPPRAPSSSGLDIGRALCPRPWDIRRPSGGGQDSGRGADL